MGCAAVRKTPRLKARRDFAPAGRSFLAVAGPVARRLASSRLAVAGASAGDWNASPIDGRGAQMTVSSTARKPRWDFHANARRHVAPMGHSAKRPVANTEDLEVTRLSRVSARTVNSLALLTPFESYTHESRMQSETGLAGTRKAARRGASLR